MENLFIEGHSGVYLTPKVSLNASDGHCEISGESYLENTAEFYRDILEWFRNFTADTSRTIQITFRLTYFNTSSSKVLLELLLMLRDFVDEEGTVIVKWYYPDDDPDLLAEAQDFMEDCELDFQLIPYRMEY